MLSKGWVNSILVAGTYQLIISIRSDIGRGLVTGVVAGRIVGGVGGSVGRVTFPQADADLENSSRPRIRNTADW
jgi:hypothetical protein